MSSESQLRWHNRMGGILPTEAERLHKQAIDSVVTKCIDSWNSKRPSEDFWSSVDAVAATVKPGLTRCLKVGVAKALALCQMHGKPFVPVHHMRAHALTARMQFLHDLQYPFLCLLISGGHCLLVLVRDFDEHVILGTSPDVAPGDALDKAARRMALGYVRSDLQSISGGAAIEILANEAFKNYTDAQFKNRSHTAHVDYRFGMKQTGKRDCNFSFAGMRYAVDRHMGRIETNTAEFSEDRLTELRFLAASVQYYVFVQLARKTQRAMEILNADNLADIFPQLSPTPEQKVRRLVISGGVACNKYIRTGFELLAEEMSEKLREKWTVFVPNATLCADNGAMIAWNAIEMIRNASPCIISESELPSEYAVNGSSPIGHDYSDFVTGLNWQLKEKIRLGYRVADILNGDKVLGASSAMG